MKSAVLFIIFKREDTTRRVFERIREAQPPRLYIAADGPRKDRADEVMKCAVTRKQVETIDWPCEVYRLYRDENLGCGRGVSSAITWFFEHEEQGIILEDDILPHIDFFRYCDEMLERYKNDECVQLITGRNAFYKTMERPYSYYSSCLYHIWGWASWRRVWYTYEYDVSSISRDLFEKKLSERQMIHKTKKYWIDIFKLMQTNPIDTWDFQLYFNEVLFERYTIVPYVNMTENIGFDPVDATHTTKSRPLDINHKALSPYPLKYPTKLCLDIEADALFARNFGFVRRSFFERLATKVRLFIRNVR